MPTTRSLPAIAVSALLIVVGVVLGIGVSVLFFALVPIGVGVAILAWQRVRLGDVSRTVVDQDADGGSGPAGWLP